MEIKTLAHMGLVVKDIEKTRWFYGTVLGMEEVPRPEQFRFRGAWFQSGDSQLHMILAEDTVAPTGFEDAGNAVKTGLATHIAFEVPDLDAVVTRLKAHDVEIKGGPMPRGDGVVQVYLHDPDGYMVEFFQWVGDEAAGGPTRDPFSG
ncbi:MAG: VOC family protein [Chloroflexota bacterium]